MPGVIYLCRLAQHGLNIHVIKALLFNKQDADEIGSFVFTYQYKCSCETFLLFSSKSRMCVSSSKECLNNTDFVDCVNKLHLQKCSLLVKDSISAVQIICFYMYAPHEIVGEVLNNFGRREVSVKGPYADHILIPQGATGSSTFFGVE